MHFLIGLGIVVGLVAFAFGVNTARKIVIGMFGVAALADCFFGYLAYISPRRLRREAGAWRAGIDQRVYSHCLAARQATGNLRADWDTKSNTCKGGKILIGTPLAT